LGFIFFKFNFLDVAFAQVKNFIRSVDSSMNTLEEEIQLVSDLLEPGATLELAQDDLNKFKVGVSDVNCYV
jgi:hypothetical protein